MKYKSEKGRKDGSPANSQESASMSALNRYARYLIIACLSLLLVYFITSFGGSQQRFRPISNGQTTDSKLPLQGTQDTNNEVVMGGGVAGNGSSMTQTGFLSESIEPQRVNATFVTLARNTDIWDIAKSIRQVEDRFNHRYHYDWVFLNDKPFDDNFIKLTSSLASGKTRYGTIPTEHWSFPSFIDQNRAAKVRDEMQAKKIIYGDSISYRHMCRYESGFFFRHPLMLDYEWYWRVEPSVELFCDINYDPFKFMAVNGKKYSFVLSLYEYHETIPTMWDSVKRFMTNHPEHLVDDNMLGFVSDDGGKTYNNCHFWSNFEIGSLNWLRSPAYLDYFNTLDRDGGFYYERWGDAPVHSVAAALTLRKDEIHFFNDIAYYHVPFTHCPKSEKLRLDNKCHCDPAENFDWNGYSCTARYFELTGLEKPEGAPLSKRQVITIIVLAILAVIFVGGGLGALAASRR